MDETLSELKIAVLTCTRDRLLYTQNSFSRLKALAGCEYDHYVLDQGSEDGTKEWLAESQVEYPMSLDLNVGICVGLNLLMEFAKPRDYDVYVRFDNDCEVLQRGTLELVARLACEHGMILAPKVLGLRHPPQVIQTLTIDGYEVDETSILGGVFMAIPRVVFDQGFSFDERQLPWKGDELVCPWWRERGGHCGYLRNVDVMHDSERHDRDFPHYFRRKSAEIGRRS